MDFEKLNRTVNLRCPTCTSTFFEAEAPQGEATEIVICTSCKRRMTKDELLAFNSENISEHVQEIGQLAANEVAEHLRKSLSKAFRIR